MNAFEPGNAYPVSFVERSSHDVLIVDYEAVKCEKSHGLLSHEQSQHRGHNT